MPLPSAPAAPICPDPTLLQMPRRRLTSRRRTSKYLGVGSSNRKNQWQARILYHGKVTHLGYYRTEEAAARVYDRCARQLLLRRGRGRGRGRRWEGGRRCWRGA
jgi:hypothetical protein